MAPEPPHEARNSSIADLLQEAVLYSAGSFESSEEVNGAALVEWFSEWRIRAGRALDGHEVA